MNILMTKKIRHGLRAVLTPDDCPEDPRDGDNATTIMTWHRQRALGDVSSRKNPAQFLAGLLEEFHPTLRDMPEDQRDELSQEELLEQFPYAGIIRPILMYDHSSITLETAPFSCPWDSGWLGWVYISPENLEEFGLDCPEKAAVVIQEELKILEAYTNGEVFKISIQDDYEIVESIGTIYRMETTAGPHGLQMTVPAPGCPRREHLDEILLTCESLKGGDQALAQAAPWTKTER